MVIQVLRPSLARSPHLGVAPPGIWSIGSTPSAGPSPSPSRAVSWFLGLLGVVVQWRALALLAVEVQRG